MPDIRRAALIALSSVLLIGTIYSVSQNTYLDTSNPLLTHLPHKLSDTHYFASKKNPLNVYFIKKAWGWTTAVFLFSFFTSPPSIRTRDRVARYVTLTALWLLFTSWFFGPALIDRVTVYSGAECVYQTPSGAVRTAPLELCYSKKHITPASHPALFGDLEVDSAGIGQDSADLLALSEGWRVLPRLRRGHDISGHVFMLTMATMFLADELRASLSVPRRVWSSAHVWAVGVNVVMLGIWMFSVYTTSVYFHSPFEKFTGYLLGVAGYAVTQSSFFSNLFGRSEAAVREPRLA
ncbi:hypothetical protein CPC08DRAFT_704537 [Agrocybe pediades]|nr:hypothetical protein CPC08DRAFT_704537 [Agrocybe pediades]